ncbi:MAG TPA: hypothetical protein GXZ27_09740 [Thermoanaerobacterales bacterium]|nr:hypothetical protein [Thermoanaerobacterales bacterium]
MKVITSAKVSSIDEGVITYQKDGVENKSQKFDTIVMAAGMQSYTPLKETFRQRRNQIHRYR